MIDTVPQSFGSNFLNYIITNTTTNYMKSELRKLLCYCIEIINTLIANIITYKRYIM